MCKYSIETILIPYNKETYSTVFNKVRLSTNETFLFIFLNRRTLLTNTPNTITLSITLQWEAYKGQLLAN